MAMQLYNVEEPYLVESEDCIRDDGGDDISGIMDVLGCWLAAARGGGEGSGIGPHCTAVEQTGGPDSSLDMRSGVEIGFQS